MKSHIHTLMRLEKGKLIFLFFFIATLLLECSLNVESTPSSATQKPVLNKSKRGFYSKPGKEPNQTSTVTPPPTPTNDVKGQDASTQTTPAPPKPDGGFVNFVKSPKFYIPAIGFFLLIIVGIVIFYIVKKNSESKV